jgi:hypothetical protein
MSDFTTNEGMADTPSASTPDTSSQVEETRSPVEVSRAAWDDKFAATEGEDSPNVSNMPGDTAVKTAAAVEQEKAVEEALAAIKWSDGKEYKVPAIFKDTLEKAGNLDRDYTQKQQRFAQERQEVETALKEEYERVLLHREHVAEMTEGRQIEQQLAQYKDIDFTAWAAQDPQAAGKHQVIRNELNNRLQQLQNSVSEKIARQEQDAKRQQNISILRAQDEIKKSIPGWGPEVAQKVTEFAANTLSIPMEVLNDLNQFPWAVRALHMAMGQHQALSAAQPQNLPKPTPEPVPKVGGSAPSAKNPDHLSMSDWLKWRNSNVAKARQSGSRIH